MKAILKVFMEYLIYILVTLLALAFLGLVFYPYLKLNASRGRNAPSLEGLLDSGEEPPGRLLIYFMTPQCGMCKPVTPIVDELAAMRDDVIRIDASEQPEIAARFGILGTPAFVFVKDGLIHKVKLGGMSEKKILSMLTDA